jgi:hypothetical protein
MSPFRRIGVFRVCQHDRNTHRVARRSSTPARRPASSTRSCSAKKLKAAFFSSHDHIQHGVLFRRAPWRSPRSLRHDGKSGRERKRDGRRRRHPGAIEEVVVGITIRELSGPTDCKVSVRTTPLVNANELSCAVRRRAVTPWRPVLTLKATAEQTRRGLLEALGDIFPLKT